ncbi:MAG: MFS transporter [Micropruina sp.]
MIFVAGLLISATAPIWPVFLTGRVIQGLGVGAILSMAYVIVGIVYPPTLQARALALISGAWTVAALVGPLVSSALVEVATWRILFYALIPIVVVAGILTVRGLPTLNGSSRPGAGLTRHVLFSIALAVATAVVLAGLERRTIPVLVVMVVLGGIVMVLALRQVAPVGTLSARRGVPAGIATRAVLSLAFFGIEVFLAQTLATAVIAGLGAAILSRAAADSPTAGFAVIFALTACSPSPRSPLHYASAARRPRRRTVRVLWSLSDGNDGTWPSWPDYRRCPSSTSGGSVLGWCRDTGLGTRDFRKS